MTRGSVRQVRREVFRYSSRDIVAIWHGGEYVDLFTPGTSSREALSGDATPFDCLNVWDHATDAPMIERTADAFRRYMDDRMTTARVVRSGFPGEVWIEETDGDA